MGIGVERKKKDFSRLKKCCTFATVKVDRFVMIATTRKNAKHMIFMKNNHFSNELLHFNVSHQKVKVT